jgi:hypothetical protein
MNEIQIYDEFLNSDELNILNAILNIKMYNFNHKSGNREKIVTPFFSIFNTEDFFLIYMKNKIELCTRKKFNIVRHYMHVQTFGQDGGYHTDDSGKNKYTFCLYINGLNDSQIDDASGEFLIKIPNEKYIMSINTINNRSLFFHSEYIHKGLAYNNFISEPRLCITWKLEEIL